MLEDIEINDGVVVSGTPYIIDFGQSRVKDMADTLDNVSKVYDFIGWLRRRSTSEANICYNCFVF